MATNKPDDKGAEALLRMMFGKSAKLFIERFPLLLEAWGFPLNTFKHRKRIKND